VSAPAFRRATVADVDAIAQLHAESWRWSYRGIYSDAFLDGDAVAERLAVWQKRLSEPEPGAFTVVAELDDAIVGFAHVVLEDGPPLGAVLQNIHVAPGCKRRGIGSRLMAEVGRELGDLRLAVWVREDNAAAQAFYEARGGRRTRHELGGPFADGSRAPVVRYEWRDAVTTNPTFLRRRS